MITLPDSLHPDLRSWTKRGLEKACLDAAQLIEADYYKKDFIPDLRASIDQLTVSAVHDEEVLWLIVRGSDDWRDWALNMKALPKKSNIEVYSKYHPGLLQGSSGAIYHAGFLSDARLVYMFVLGLQSKAPAPPQIALTGHSRGAAIAAIVGASMALPTIGFGCPRHIIRRSSTKLPGEHMVLLINRSDDMVGFLPPADLGFDHLGTVFFIRPRRRHWGEDHRIPHYIALMKGEAHG